MDIFKGIGDFFGGLFGQKKKREDEQPQPQQQQSAVSFNSTPKLGDNFANNSSNPTQPQQPKEFAKSSVDLNPVKPVQPVQPQPQVNRDQERQQLANKYRQEETDRYNQGSDHAANFLNDIFSGGKTAQMRENTINQNIQNRVNAEMLRKYGPDDQQVKQNIAQTSQDINNKATSVNDFTKNYNNTVQQTVASPVSAVKGAANSVVETMPKVSGAVTELGANTIKLFDEDNQFANNLINRVRADREKNIVRKTLNSATGLTDQDNKMAYGLGSSGTRMAIDAAMTPVTGGVAPALVHGVEAHSEMMDSLDNIEARKKAEAAAKGEAYTPSSFGSRYLAATANAGAQAAIEKLGIDNVTGKIGGKFAKNMVGRAVTGALGEAGEEAAQQYAENFTKKLFDNKQNIHEGVAESALMGGIMGGAGKMAFGGMDSVKNPYDVNNGKFNNYNPKSLIEAERNAVRTGIFNKNNANSDLSLADAEFNVGAPERLSKALRNGADGDVNFMRMPNRLLGGVNAIRQEKGLSNINDNTVVAYKNAINNHLAKRIGEGMSPESSAHIAADSIINPYSNVYAGTKSKNGYNRDHIHLVAAPNGDKYNSSTVSEFNGGLSLKNIAPRDISEIKKSQAMLGAPLVGHKPEGIGISSGLGDIAAPQGVRTNNIAQNPQKVNTYSKGSVNHSGFANPYAQNNQHTTFVNDRDSSSIFGDGFDPRGRNGSVNKDGGFGIEIKHNLNPDNYQLTDSPELNHELVRLMEETFDRTVGLNTTKQNIVADFYDDPDFESALEAKERWYEDLDPNVEQQIWEDIFKDRGYELDYESNDEGLLRKKDDYMDYERINEMLKNAADDVQWGHDESNSLAAGPIISRYPRVLDEQIRLADHSNGRSNDYEVRYSEDDLRNKRISSQDIKRDFLDEITRLVEDKRDSLGEFTNVFNEGGLAEGVEYLVDNLPHTEADPNSPYRFTVYGREVDLSRFKGETDAEVIANDATDQILEALTEERDDVDYQNVNDNTLNNAQNINSLYGITTKENIGTSNFRENSSTGSYSDVSSDSLARNDQKVNRMQPFEPIERTPLVNGDRDFGGSFGNGFDPRGENSAVNKAAFPKVQKEDLATPELEKYGIKPTKTEYNQALEYILMEERPELFERYEKARLGLEALEENIDFNQFTPTELERLYGKNYAEHLDRGMISQMVRKNSLNGLDQAAMGGDIGEIDMEDYIDRLNHYYETKREVKDLEQEIREAYADPELREEAKQALWFNKYEEIENAVANLRQNGVDIDFDGYVQLKYGNKAKNEAVKTEEEPSNEDIIDENTKTDKSIVSEAPLVKETDQKTRKFAETVLDTDTPPKDFVKLMHAGDESLKYTPKKNSEMWSRATKSVQESPERVFNELENTRVANDETMAKGIALAKHYQAMGDDLKASELYVELAKKATEAGRTVQALNLMRRTTPEGVLMSTMREVESYNDKMKNKPNKQINITPEQRAEFLGRLREAYAMPEGN